MKKFFDKLISKVLDKNVLVGIIILAIAVVSAVGLFYVDVNSDLFSYLPKESEMSKGLEKMTEYFEINSNILIAVQGEREVDGKIEGASEAQIAQMTSEIEQVEGVSAVIWVGDIDELGSSVPFGGDEVLEKGRKLLTKDDMYLVMINLKHSAASEEAKVSLAQIRSITAGMEVAYGGTTPLTQDIYTAAFKELPWYLIASVVLVLIILVLTAKNYVEPIIFLSTLGVSILVNMGTNIIFGEISIITFCAASVLQLGLAMDYAIFLTHTYYEERERGFEAKQAMKNAIPRTFATITASALTTIAGMATLFAMRFTVGGDIARVIIKGIVLAWLSVLFLQPCLIMWCRKAMEKTKKKALDFHFAPLARVTVKNRIPVVIVTLLLIVPSFIGQLYLDLNYVAPLLAYDTSSPLEEYANSMNTAMFVCVPVEETDEGLAKQYQFLDNLQPLIDDHSVASVTGIFSMVDKSIAGKASTFRAVKAILNTNPMSDMLYNEGYTLYIIGLNEQLPIESDQTDAVLQRVRGCLFDVFSHDEAYISGTVQGVSDFRAITPKDFLLISILSAVSVLLVLIVTFRSIKYPILLVLLIQLGIWINYSINTIFGLQMNFVSYLAISAVQLGATVDYAILLTKKFRTLRKEGKNSLEASYEASRSSSMSVLTSASIMIVACLSVGIIASNQIVKEVALLVARGAAISCVLVLLVLPSLLACSERLAQFVKDEGGVKGLAIAYAKKMKVEGEALKEKLKLDKLLSRKSKKPKQDQSAESSNVKQTDAQGFDEQQNLQDSSNEPQTDAQCSDEQQNLQDSSNEPQTDAQKPSSDQQTNNNTDD